MIFRHKTTNKLVSCYEFYGEDAWPNNPDTTTYLLDVFPEPLKLISFHQRAVYVNSEDPSDTRTLNVRGPSSLMRVEDFISQYEPVPEDEQDIHD